MEIWLKFIFEQIGSVSPTVDNFFFKWIALPSERITIFETDTPSPSNRSQFFPNEQPKLFKRMTLIFFFGTDSRSQLFKRTTIFSKQIAQAVRMDDNFFGTDTQIPNPFKKSKTFFNDRVTVIRGTQRQFSKNICSEDDLRSRIFRTFVVKFLACLPLLGFSNI